MRGRLRLAGRASERAAAHMPRQVEVVRTAAERLLDQYGVEQLPTLFVFKKGASARACV